MVKITFVTFCYTFQQIPPISIFAWSSFPPRLKCNLPIFLPELLKTGGPGPSNPEPISSQPSPLSSAAQVRVPQASRPLSQPR